MRITLVNFLILIVCFASFTSKAQTCASNYNNPWQWESQSRWFFGDGVLLHFANGTASPTDSYIPVSGDDNRGYEGTAAISDNNGNLLAYSNGRSLWRADGTLIANDMLAGNEGGSVGERSSAVQGIVAVRHPGNPNLIYIFTSDDALTNADLGLNYTVLDLTTMTSTAPVRLNDHNGNPYRATEQVDATFHSNGEDIWIIARQSGRNNPSNFTNFFAYELTCAGLNTTPVLSNVGPTVDGTWNNSYDRGALKASWDATKIATVNHISGGDDYDDAIVIYDFDNATGQLSNPKPSAAVWGGFWWAGTTYQSQYDCEWAPNSQGLYVVAAAGSARLLWLDASLGTATDIYNSIRVVTTSVSVAGDLKLGGDNVLYQATQGSSLNTYSFGSIADLNAGNGVSTGTFNLNQGSALGLSNMFIPPVEYLEIQDPGPLACSGGTVDLSVINLCANTNAEDPVNNPNGWSASCGPCITDAANGIFDPSIAGAGTHDVYYSSGVNCTKRDTIQITVNGPCGACDDTTLANVINPLCIGESVDLSTYEITTDGGTWSIVGTPAGTNPAVITGGNTFDANGADPGTYRIRFTLNSAPSPTCADSSERDILVNALPSINISPNPAEFCAGDSVELDAGIGAMNYAWTPSGDNTQTTWAANAGTYQVVVTDPGTGCIDSASINVTENALPVINITPNPAEFCAGDSVELDAGIGGQNYAWTPTGDNTQTTWAASGGAYQVVVTDPGTGCVDSASINVTENALPVVNLTPNPAEFCAGDSVELDAGIGGQNYAWTPTGDNTQTTWATSGGVHQVVVTDPVTGCADSASVNVTENALPVINITPNPADFCAGDSVELDAGIGGQNYAWTPTGDNTQTTWTTSGGAYQVVVTDPGTGCVDSASINVTENALPVINITPNPAEFCAGDSVELDAGVAGQNYAWTPTGDNTQTTWATSGGAYQVVVTDPGTGCSDSASINVAENSLPTVNITPNPAAFCSGDSVLIDAGNAGAVSYVWTPTGETTQTIYAQTGGAYQVVVSDNATGCSDSASVTITENPLPAINLNPNPADFCAGDSLLLDAGIGGAYDYVWSPNGETTQTIYANTGGVYQVVVTDQATGCLDSASVTITENPLPVVDLGADTTICANVTTPLDAGNPGATHSWTRDGAAFGNSQNIDATSGAEYIVTVTDGNGCSTMDTIQIGEFDIPVVDLGADTGVCEEINLILDADTANDVISYLWSPSNATSRYDTLVDFSGSVSVVVTDTNGCENSDNLNVTLYSLPVVDLGPDTSTCQGGDVTFAGPDDMAVYLWNDGSNAQTLTGDEPDSTYWLSVVDTNGCTASDTVDVSDRGPITVDLGQNTVTLCANESMTLDAGSFDEPTTYIWSTGENTQQVTYSNLPATNDTISVQVYDRYNCPGSDSARRVVLPIPTVEIFGGDSSFCSLGKEVYEAFIVYTGAFPGDILWSNGETDTSTTITYAPTTVWVSYTDSNGCASADTINLEEYCEPTELTLPNVFVPGGETNNVFEPIEKDNETYWMLVNNVIESDFQVFNRWGVKMFQSDALLPSWDGYYNSRPVSAGTYFWIWRYKDSSLKTYELNGFVEVVQQSN